MKTYEFRSSFISSELNLNAIAKHFGINKKFRWEEPLILGEDYLKGVIPHPLGKTAYLFHFGSIACINLTIHEMKDIAAYMKRIDKNIKDPNPFNYLDDFKLILDENSEFELNYMSVTVNTLKAHQLDMVATVLAKSVALENIESDIDVLLDEIENVITFLDKGKLNLGDLQLAKMSGKVLRFKYNTISYIMLLEKPDIAWKNEAAEDLFIKLSDLFELSDRYERIRHKTELLMDITEVFSGLTHAKRGNRLEWMVIILILIELLMSIIEKVFPRI